MRGTRTNIVALPMTKMAWLRWLLKLSFLAGWLLVGAARGIPQEPPSPVTITEVRLGVDGTAKVGYWTLVTVGIQAGSRPLEVSVEIWAPDADGALIAWQHEDQADREQIVTLAAGQKVHVQRYVRLGRTRGKMLVRVRAEGRVMAERAVDLTSDVRVLESSRQWHVVIGGDVPIEKVWQRRRRTAELPPWISRWQEPHSLPREPRAYDGVDYVWLLTGQTELLENTAAQTWQALFDWVACGGKLIVSLGKNGPRWAGPEGVLRPLLPTACSGVSVIEEATGLEAFAHADRPLEPFPAATVEGTLPRVVAWFDRRSQGKLPAIARYALGMGQGTCVLFDLAQPPFVDWPATQTVLAEVWRPEQQEQRAAGREELSQRVVHLGFEDLVGQLRAALDYFPATERLAGVRVVPFTAIAALVVVYVLWLGPGDYWLLRLLRCPMEFTWITWPLGIVAFCGVVALLNAYWKQVPHVRLNQVDVVDVDLETGWVRGSMWACAYSPNLRQYNLQLQGEKLGLPDTPGVSGALFWQGLPGTGMGGLDVAGIETTAYQPYAIRTREGTNAARMIDVPIAAAGTRMFQGEWFLRHAPGSAGDVWVDRNGLLKGTFTNPLTISLSNVLIVHGRWAYRVEGTLAPRQSVAIENLTRRDLEWLLTRRRILATHTSYASLPWDIHSRDVPRIMEMILFHNAAGGKAYTGLFHRYQANLDMSSLLDLGRAVVVGQTNQPATTVYEGQTPWTGPHSQVWTWFRLVLPVSQRLVAPAEVGPQ